MYFDSFNGRYYNRPFHTIQNFDRASQHIREVQNRVNLFMMQNACQNENPKQLLRRMLLQSHPDKNLTLNYSHKKILNVYEFKNDLEFLQSKDIIIKNIQIPTPTIHPTNLNINIQKDNIGQDHVPMNTEKGMPENDLGTQESRMSPQINILLFIISIIVLVYHYTRKIAVWSHKALTSFSTVDSQYVPPKQFSRNRSATPPRSTYKSYYYS